LPKITPIDPYKLIRLLGKLGFKPVQQKDSHVIIVKHTHSEFHRTELKTDSVLKLTKIVTIRKKLLTLIIP